MTRATYFKRSEAGGTGGQWVPLSRPPMPDLSGSAASGYDHWWAYDYEGSSSPQIPLWTEEVIAQARLAAEGAGVAVQDLSGTLRRSADGDVYEVLVVVPCSTATEKMLDVEEEVRGVLFSGFAQDISIRVAKSTQ